MCLHSTYNASNNGFIIFGFSGVDDSQKSIVLSYRGTEGDLQLIVEILTANKPVTFTPAPSVQVSDYFFTCTNLVYASVKADMQRLIAAHPGYTVYITGHSLGASVSVVTATQLALDGVLNGASVVLYNFGLPRTGSYGFAHLVDSIFPTLYRVVHYQVRRATQSNRVESNGVGKGRGWGITAGNEEGEDGVLGNNLVREPVAVVVRCLFVAASRRTSSPTSRPAARTRRATASMRTAPRRASGSVSPSLRSSRLALDTPRSRLSNPPSSLSSLRLPSPPKSTLWAPAQWTYHVDTEVWYQETMPYALNGTAGSYQVCTGVPAGEDPACSNGVTGLSGSDHVTYFSMNVGDFCASNLRAPGLVHA